MSGNHGLADELRSRILTPDEKLAKQARERDHSLEFGVYSIMHSIKLEAERCAIKGRRKLTYKYSYEKYYTAKDAWKPKGGMNAYYSALRELVIQKLEAEGFQTISVSKHLSFEEGMELHIKISW